MPPAPPEAGHEPTPTPGGLMRGATPDANDLPAFDRATDGTRAGKPDSAAEGAQPTVADLPDDVPQPTPGVAVPGQPRAGQEAGKRADLPTQDIRSTHTAASGTPSKLARAPETSMPGTVSATTQLASSGLTGSSQPRPRTREPSIPTATPTTPETTPDSTARPAMTSKGPVTGHPIEPSGPVEDLMDGEGCRPSDQGRCH